MRLTLICGANPKIAKDGPRTRLHVGRWCVEEDGVVDTKYTILLNDTPIENIHDILVEKPSALQMVYVTRGNEKHISIWVRKIA